MAHHKRRRSKNARAGCLMCKPAKNNAYKDSFYYQTKQEKKARISEKEQLNGLVQHDSGTED